MMAAVSLDSCEPKVADVLVRQIFLRRSAPHLIPGNQPNNFASDF
jgi:hypothetical protein